MSLTKRIPEVLGLVAALVLAGGCETLNIKNPNAPDSARLLSDPATVQAIAVGAMRTWYNTTQCFDGCLTLLTMADSHIAAWNNWQIRFYTGCTPGPLPSPPFPAGPFGTCGQSPTDPTVMTSCGPFPGCTREPWQNDPAAAQRLEIETLWYGYYSALSSANDVVKAIRTPPGLVITDASTTKMVETMAVLIQALSLSGIAINYDKGFIVDYNSTLSSLQLSTRTQVRDAALAKFDEAIALANANPFTALPDFFDTPAQKYDNVKIAQIANTMAARTLAYFPRDAAENATVNWGQVASYASKGISSATSPFNWTFKDDNCVNWCDGIKNWTNNINTMRVHTRVAHLLDPATQPDPWYKAGNSSPSSADKRLGNGTYRGLGGASYAAAIGVTLDATGAGGTDYVWAGAKQEIQNPARGTWHQSAIGQVRYNTLSGKDPNGTVNGFGDGPVVLAAENDLIWAEALIRTSASGAAAHINNTRVGRGGLPAATDGDANILQELQYEQDVELPGSNFAPYYNRRRIDALQPLTPHEFPVPAKELGVLQCTLYTWGGATLNSGPTDPAKCL